MTTLKKQLDEKITNASIEDLWKEIRELFLNTDYKKLKREGGFTIHIFINDFDEIFYIINNESATGNRFKQKYNSDILDSVILLYCEKEGITVKKENKDVYLTYIFSSN